MTADALCFSVRRLNPFLGVTQVVELEIGRALSSDAINWEIQLAVERPAGWGSLNRNRSERQYYRYGAWSEDEGLANFPVHPRLNAPALRESADSLVAAVCGAAIQIPYALADRFELWLLDSRDEMPVALLAAVASQHLTHMHRPTEWSAAAAGDDTLHALTSTCLDGARTDMQSPRGYCNRLEALVRRRTGSARRAKWFERASHVDAGDAPDAGKPFPELPITERWENDADARLVADYLAWLAPRLLTLPMSLATRARLEVAAAAQPLPVNRLFPLYPAVADGELLNRLRVQARIMAAVAVD